MGFKVVVEACGLNPKSTRGMSHFLVWLGVARSHTNISLPQLLCEWLEDWTRKLIGHGIINGNH